MSSKFDEKYFNLLKSEAQLTNTLNLKDALFLITESAAKLTNSTGGSVLLLDRKKNKLIFTVATGPEGPEIVNKDLEIDEGFAGWVVKNRAPIISNSPANDERHSSKIDTESDFKTESLIAVPLIVQDDIIGVLETVNKISGEYTKREMEMLVSFAELAAVSIMNAQELDNLREENVILKESESGKYNLIGESPVIRNLRKTILQVAEKPVTVLITGESGTGKEIVARQIHTNSLRSENAFVKVSCASLNENLLESELFGHEKGAFTGATTRHIGKFERGNGGTFFLDEIGEISERVQVKLLRVLQEREIERVGGSETIPVDVRILSATNRDLLKAVDQGRFREDLYYRLNVIEIHIPPLRERKQDIPILSRYILNKLKNEFNHPVRQISQEAMTLLMRHNFPGNVRELENILERAAVLSNGSNLLPDNLPKELLQSPQEREITTLTLPELERKRIVQALLECNGNKSKAARVLDITRDRLRYRIKTFKIIPKEYS